MNPAGRPLAGTTITMPPIVGRTLWRGRARPSSGRNMMNCPAGLSRFGESVGHPGAPSAPRLKPEMSLRPPSEPGVWRHREREREKHVQLNGPPSPVVLCRPGDSLARQLGGRKMPSFPIYASILLAARIRVAVQARASSQMHSSRYASANVMCVCVGARSLKSRRRARWR